MRAKHRIVAFLLVTAALLNIMPLGLIPAVAQEQEVSSLPDLEAGKTYAAELDLSVGSHTELYKLEGAQLIAYGSRVAKSALPQKLIVRYLSKGDEHVYVAGSDWPEAYETYRFVALKELRIIGEYTPELRECAYTYGQVSLECDVAIGDNVFLGEGMKEHVFTSVGELIGDSAQYQWEMKIDGDRWATINGYFYPYAVISETLLVNAPGGKAVIRCVVTDNGVKYASPSLTVQRASAVGAEVVGTLEQSEKLSYAFADSAESEPASSSGDASEGFQIVISYVYRHETAAASWIDGTAAANVFSVSLPAGGHYKGVVTSPYVVGYSPYVRYDLQTGDVVDGVTIREYPEGSGVYYKSKPNHEFFHQMSKFELVVYYIPDQVEFLVKHFEQNLQDDEYTLVDTEVLSGYANEAVGEGLEDADKLSNGFTAIHYEPETAIAANGVTVIEIYYDRIYYLVDFELDGGFGEAPFYVRYGTNITLGAPTKPGYTFRGWELERVYTVITEDKENVEIDTPEAEWPSAYRNVTPTSVISIESNLHYGAKWAVATSTYTVIYWRENADSDNAGDTDNYSIWATRTVSNVPTGSHVDCTGADFDISDPLATTTIDGANVNEKPYFTRADAMSDESITVKGDGSSIVNIYYTRNTYHIFFSGISGKCVLEEHTHGEDCERELLCRRDIHTHTAECKADGYTCGMVEHTEHSHDGSEGSCTKTLHTHTHECYSISGGGAFDIYPVTDNTTVNNIVNSTSIDANGVVRTGYAFGSWYNTYQYYFNIGGTWYQVRNYSAGNTRITTNDSCPGYSHTATDGLCDCEIPLHTHTEDCEMKCGYKTHVHTDACYDGCDRYTHTHTNNCNTSASTSRYIWVISAKYNANIADVWPTAEKMQTVNDTVRLYGWTGINSNSTLVTKRVNMTSDLCDTDSGIKYGKADTTNSTAAYSIYYLFESFDQTSAASGDQRRQYSDKYYDSDPRYEQTVYGLSGNLNPKQITGVKTDVSQSVSSGNTRYLYYSRNRHDIYFGSVGNEIYKVEGVMFEQPIDTLTFETTSRIDLGKWRFTDENGDEVEMDIPIPTTPTAYEEGSVYFDGWYTTPMCVPGTEYNFATEVLPDQDVYLYAKWSTMKYSVEVYLDTAQTKLATPRNSGTGDHYGDTFPLTVDFGTRLTEPAHYNSEADLLFAGWYYVEDGVEKRFDFNTMTIKRDYLKSGGEDNTAIYAKWTSQTPIDYVVYYMLNDGDTHIAEPLRSKALAGRYKSFEAKVGEDLYDGYRTGYYPSSRFYSREIKPKAEDNVFIFYYSQPTEVKYRIKHNFTGSVFGDIIGSDSFTMTLENSISNPLISHAVVEVEFREGLTRAAVVAAAKAVAVANGKSFDDGKDGYTIWQTVLSLSPNAYQKHMILESDPSGNDIEFEWAASTGILYQIDHHFQEIEGNAHVVDPVRTVRGVGNEGDRIKPNVLTVKGFYLNEELSAEALQDGGVPLTKFTEDGNGGLTGGLVLDVYYDRETYTFTVIHEYQDAYGNVESSHVASTQSVRYEAKVEPAVIKHDNHFLLNEGALVPYEITSDFTVTLIYRAFEVMYTYQVAPSIAGVLDSYQEKVSAGGSPVGSTPTAVDGWAFMGWYLDADGTVPVPESMAAVDPATNKIIPVSPNVNEGKVNYHFYAYFIPETRVFRNEGLLSAQNVIYRIQGVSTDTHTCAVDVSFVISGNGSAKIAKLHYGKYIVTVTGWSWRYGAPISVGFGDEELVPQSSTFELDLTGEGEVVFKYGTPNKQWLTDDDGVKAVIK